MTAVSTQEEQRSPSERLMATGRGWTATEFRCSSGPGDRPFEERHEHVTVAAVLSGSFMYRAGDRRAVLHPGSLLLGNVGACYECGHEHGTGDTCVAIHLESELFGEIAARCAGSSAFRFPTPALNAGPALTSSIALIGTAGDPLARDIAIIELAQRIVCTLSRETPPPIRTSPQDERRVMRALRYIETHTAEKIDLDDLARIAGTSKYHFLRLFDRLVGVTPYRFVLDLRLRRAAYALATSLTPVSTLALDAGFGDLSTFYRQFETAFGVSPQRYRHRPKNQKRQV